MNKNYNFERQKLNLPEYGRNILKMVSYLMTIHDRDLRNHQAKVVIDVMGNINNHLRDTDDLKHKLWDHLFIISDFRLDVDSPYPMPSPDSITPKPAQLKYPSQRIDRKHYGKNIENMIRVLKDIPDDGSRQEIIRNIAKYMRNKSHEYNQEHPSNEVIISDIRRMAGDSVEVEDGILDGSRSEFRPQISSSVRQKNGKAAHKRSNGKSAYQNPKQANTRKTSPYTRKK